MVKLQLKEWINKPGQFKIQEFQFKSNPVPQLNFLSFSLSSFWLNKVVCDLLAIIGREMVTYAVHDSYQIL